MRKLQDSKEATQRVSNLWFLPWQKSCGFGSKNGKETEKGQGKKVRSW
jgi:hypothetical protein